MTYRPVKVKRNLSLDEEEQEGLSDIAVMRNFELISQEIKRVEELAIQTNATLGGEVEDIDEQDDFDIGFLLL